MLQSYKYITHKNKKIEDILKSFFLLHPNNVDLSLKRIKKLPQSLIESLNKFKASEVVKKSIGSKVVSQYIKLKKREISEHNKVSDENKKDWERKNIIDC